MKWCGVIRSEGKGRGGECPFLFLTFSLSLPPFISHTASFYLPLPLPPPHGFFLLFHFPSYSATVQTCTLHFCPCSLCKCFFQASITRDTLYSAIFPTTPVFLCGAVRVRVRGSEGGENKVRILELSAPSM